MQPCKEKYEVYAKDSSVLLVTATYAGYFFQKGPYGVDDDEMVRRIVRLLNSYRFMPLTATVPITRYMAVASDKFVDLDTPEGELPFTTYTIVRSGGCDGTIPNDVDAVRVAAVLNADELYTLSIKKEK